MRRAKREKLLKLTSFDGATHPSFFQLGWSGEAKSAM